MQIRDYWSENGNDVSGATTAAEVMLRGRDLNFHVAKEPIALASNGREIPGKFALVREDTGAPLSVVGSQFCPLQQADALRPFDALVAEGILAYARAGASQGGRRVWIKATLPRIDAKPIGDRRVGDTVGAYVMLSHDHGEGMAVRTTLVIERLICLNGMRSTSLHGGRSIRHSASVAQRVSDAMFQLDPIRKQLDADAALASALSESTVQNDDAIAHFLAAVWREDVSETVEGRRIETIASLFDGAGIGMDLSTANGTWWGLYSALTEYLTHHSGRSEHTRTESRVWGASASVLDRGIDVAYAMGRMGEDPVRVGALPDDALHMLVESHARSAGVYA